MKFNRTNRWLLSILKEGGYSFSELYRGIVNYGPAEIDLGSALTDLKHDSYIVIELRHDNGQFEELDANLQQESPTDFLQIVKAEESDVSRHYIRVTKLGTAYLKTTQKSVEKL